MWRVSFALVIVGLCVNTAAALTGSGTQEDPWRIKSLEDFNDFAADANYWDDYTRLETDVNLAGLTYSTAVIAGFTGVFDGNDHKIICLMIDDGGVGNHFLGLFSGIQGEVRNLGLEGGSVSVAGGCVGSLVGVNSGIVSNCYSIGSVSSDIQIGGLAGYNWGGISNCYSTGDVTGNDIVGGLVGWHDGYISNCYSTSRITGSGDYLGGLVGGDEDYCSYTASFWNSDVNPDVNGIGNRTEPNVVGKTTAQMQTKNTFTSAGWDFVDVWDLSCEGMNYPRLIWQIPPADFLCPHGVDFIDYSFFSNHWRESTCGATNDCEGADLDFSDKVDGADLKIFCGLWLEGWGTK